MAENINMLHLSSLSIWYMGMGKGRLSINLPLKTFAKLGYKVKYISTSPFQVTGEFDGINAEKVQLPFSKHLNKHKRIYKLYTFLLEWIPLLIKGYKYAKKNKPNIIYAHSTDAALPAYLLSKLFRATYVLRLYGIGKPSNSKRSKLKLDFALKLRADAYIITNDGTSGKSYAIEKGVSEDRIHFLRNGISKDYWKQNVKQQLRDQIASKNEKIIITVSRLVKSKQIHIFIKLLPDLLKKNKYIKFVIIGDGDELLYLRELSISLGIKDYVIFLGSKEQRVVIDYILISDVFISMNALSSISNPVFEAMACKKAVVALNTGTTSELIRDNETGILVDPTNIKELSNKIHDILTNDSKRKYIEENAYKYIHKEWPTWEERLNYEVNLVKRLCINL